MLRLIHHINPRTWDLGLPISVRGGSRVALEETQKSMGNCGQPRARPERARGRGKTATIVAPRTRRGAGQWEPDLAASAAHVTDEILERCCLALPADRILLIRQLVNESSYLIGPQSKKSLLLHGHFPANVPQLGTFYRERSKHVLRNHQYHIANL